MAAGGRLRRSVRWDRIKAELAKPEVTVTVDLGLGSGQDHIWTCDLTTDYVKINTVRAKPPHTRSEVGGGPHGTRGRRERGQTDQEDIPAMAQITMKELLEAGSTSATRPSAGTKMAKYIFGERNGIYIIDLQKTLEKFRDAQVFARDLAANGARCCSWAPRSRRRRPSPTRRPAAACST